MNLTVSQNGYHLCQSMQSTMAVKKEVRRVSGRSRRFGIVIRFKHPEDEGYSDMILGIMYRQLNIDPDDFEPVAMKIKKVTPDNLVMENKKGIMEYRVKGKKPTSLTIEINLFREPGALVIEFEKMMTAFYSTYGIKIVRPKIKDMVRDYQLSVYENLGYSADKVELFEEKQNDRKRKTAKKVC